MGRVYRNREYVHKEANVFIFTEDCSGIGRIYDKDIFESSKSLIKEFNGKYISEKDKIEIVKELYSEDRLKGTRYWDEFKKALDILENIKEYELERNEAHSIMREINTIKAIPFEIYENHHEELEKIIEILKTSKDKEEKLQAEVLVNDLTVDVPFWKIKNCSISQLGLKGISILNCKYSPEEGLLLDEFLDNIF
ncbi:MAG: hypothetical protein NC904_08980 [Candidatus Omnitrophica bacterium]|nr:hypothetical protein [Candidatus Omnitrophota bacterium]